ncbi:nucleotidyl transferase AbiEii/AbiGii toxin family protein [Sphingomonas sp. Leaf205]|uniref:nucleotidyl transferase AbiEii/AbiGii toxin family protein n=1 Tax=Sphingomonas sp. Leaf205 TaxID=2876551 RepID=UPI001E51D36E|nr:nucleotidyl transferase AbiEii/AbiGii toxin family protein [Sphingomonas sp. Leaf205]
MTPDIARFLALDAEEREGVFITTAERLDTRSSNVEKDFWVCVVLDALFNGRPAEAHGVVFKGGTSLSKIYGAISRFSEDVDLVVVRSDLGYEGADDPASVESSLRGKPLNRALDQLRADCSAYVTGPLRADLQGALATLPVATTVEVDDRDEHRTTLLVNYPTLTDHGEGYNAPAVKIEAGARSAVFPDTTDSVTPYIADDLEDWDMTVRSVRSVTAQRTFLEKIVILHGLACRDRDEGVTLNDRNKLSRHYYDVARLSERPEIMEVLSDHDLIAQVVAHSARTFGNGWRKLDEAMPGSFNLVPRDGLASQLRPDYVAMSGMMFGHPPDMDWVLERIAVVERSVNGIKP